MTFKQRLDGYVKQPANNTHVKFTPDKNATCSPDPCSPDWLLNVDDVTQLASVFGVTWLFDAVNTYYNCNITKEICAAGLIHGYLNRFSEAKVSLYGSDSTLAKDLYVLKKEVEEDGFIVYALNCVMHTLLDEKLDFCLVALIFMDLLRSKESR